MFQLRFLIGSPRRQSPHIFCHRDYRGQRTQQDDFHPQFNTYVCEPKGTPGTEGSKTSYDVMLELMQHAAQNQPASHLFPIIEVWNPETRDRLKLAGDEIILRPTDLAAAQAAFNATQPAQIGNATSTAPVNEDITLGRNIGTQINFALQAQYEAIQPGQTINQTTLGDPTEGMLAELQSLQAAYPEAEITLIPRDPANKGSICTFATINKPLPVSGAAVSQSPSLPASESPAQPSVLDRVRAEIQTNGKATATTLSIALNIDAADIKVAVASEGSGLQNKGGWISLVS
jgi:hypothetical protein